MEKYRHTDSLWHDKCQECRDILDDYHKKPVDFLLAQSSITFNPAIFEIYLAFKECLTQYGMFLEQENWTKEVKKALTIPPSLKGDAKEMEQTPFNLLCRKASHWIQYLSDIPKLEIQLKNFAKCYWGEVKGEDEDEDDKQRLKKEKEQRLKQMKKEKKLLLQKTERMFKIMGDIVVDIGIPHYIEFIQAFVYDVERGTSCKRMDGSMFYVNGKDLSDAQKKLSPFAYILAH